MVDDLITRGVSEPYRMFTSRAEYRLSLREDNADLRLTEAGRELGLVDDVRWDAFNRKRDAIARETERLKQYLDQPATGGRGRRRAGAGPAARARVPAVRPARRPEVNYANLVTLPGCGPGLTAPDVVEQVEIQAKYHGYIERQKEEVAKAAAHESLALPADLDYRQVRGLSIEVQQKLNQHRPADAGSGLPRPGRHAGGDFAAAGASEEAKAP